MNYLALCAIVKNEALYIEEWIMYHKALGVEHFFIYDHASDDRTVDIVNSFGMHYVTVAKVSGTYVPAQGDTYNRCLRDHRNMSRWLGFIDVDEFICPANTENLHAMLVNYEEAPALGIHWMLFGSSGQLEYENRPVIERFTRRENTVNRHIKCIVNPQRTERYITPHKFHHGNAFAVDEQLRPIGTFNSIPLNGTVAVVQLNHYVTKSKKECEIRRSRPRADTGKAHGTEFFKLHDKNDVEDFRARDIWRGIKG